VIAALLLAAAPAAAAQIRRIAIIGGLGARTVATSTTHGLAAATVELLVRNDSLHAARPIGRFLPKSAGTDVRLVATAEVLHPGQIEPITLTFQASTSRAIAGTVVVGLSGKRATREQAVALAPETQANTPAVEPDEVTLHVTRDCPDFLGHLICGSTPNPIIATSASTLSLPAASRRRLASTDTGGAATITLSAATEKGHRLPGGLLPATISAKADSHGEYSTTFVLDPEAKQDGQIKVKVDVQVWWLYPLVVLVFGAFLGYLVRWWTGPSRDRDVLKARLEEERKRYEDELADRSPSIYPLKRWFGGFSQRLPAIPRPKEFRSTTLSGFAKCWREVQEARSNTDIENASKQVDALHTDVTTWCEVNQALKDIDVLFKECVPDEAERISEIPAYQDTGALIKNQLPQPADAAGAGTMISAVEAQGEIVAAYARALRAYGHVNHNVNTYAAYDPKVIYGTRADPVERAPSAARSLNVKLTEAAYILEQHPEPGVAPRAAAMAGIELAAVGAPSSAAREQAPPTPTKASVQPPEKKRDPLHLRKEITVRDWLVFIATLLVSAVVYLLTLYVGKHFGSPNEYIEAFAVGFAGQTLAGVAAIPLARSLMNVEGKPTAA
jgi:hypothetical protein